MRIFECWGHGADEGNLWRAVLNESGDDFAAAKRDKNISRNAGGICSGPQSSGGWPTNKGTRRPTFAANMRDVGPTIAANETTLFANSPQTSL